MRLTALILVLFLPLLSSAQKPEDWIKLGDEHMEQKDYATATECYREAMLLDSTTFELNVKYAESLRLSRDYVRAEYYYDKVYTKDRGKLFREGQFWLGMMQKANGDYKEAQRNLKKYLSRVKREKDGYWYQKASQEIDACSFAINALRDSSELILTQLGEKVNTRFSDFSTALRDSTLYFSSSRMEGVRIFRSTSGSGEFKDVEEQFTGINNTQYLQGNPAFHPDEARVYFSVCENGRCDIWTARVDGNKWLEAEKLEKVNASGATTTMPMIAKIGKDLILFMSSDRDGTQGKMDIWWSQLGRDGWGIPVNAGGEVNSIDNEISPFYYDDALYFSSDWHQGFGGFDIFRSKGLPRSFGKPENMGFPFNTQANDIYWTYFPDRHEGYISSNRQGSYVEEGELCCNDLYRFQYADSLKEDEGEYADLEDLNKYLPVTLYFHNDEPNPNTRDTTTKLSYLDAYNSYKALVPRYLKEASKGKAGEQAENAEFEMEEFFEFKVDKGYNDLAQFARLLLVELQKGLLVELSVKGFASPRAESDYNLNLTRRRIASMVNFLRRYEDGIFIPYLEGTSPDGGVLTVEEVPFGEYQASQRVSDELGDEQNSIYSIGACLERKIEIRSVQRALTDRMEEWMISTRDTVDFGNIKASDFPPVQSFEIRNISPRPLTIADVQTECGCTVAVPGKDLLQPGESTTIEVRFDPLGKQGEQLKSVLIYIEEAQDPLQVFIRAIVE